MNRIPLAALIALLAVTVVPAAPAQVRMHRVPKVQITFTPGIAPHWPNRIVTDIFGIGNLPQGGHFHFRHHGRFFGPSFSPFYASFSGVYYPYYAYPMPYVYADPAQQGGAEVTPSVDYGRRGAQTADDLRYNEYLDRRERDLDRRERDLEGRERAAKPAVQSAATPVVEQKSEPQDPTVLIFHDGHQLEVTNYAIVGDRLINLSGDGPRKIPLAELDIPATIQANDDRGLEFSVPPSGPGT